MILRLTEGQVNLLRDYTPDPAFEPWMKLVEQVTTTQWEATLPPIGWLRVFERLERDSINARGQNVTGKIRVSRLRNTIRRALNGREAHPALAGYAMPGTHGLIIPAWRTPEGAWSPYPIPPRQMFLLYPRHAHRGHEVPYTEWMPEDPGGGRVWARNYTERLLYDPATHNALHRVLTD